MAMGPIQLVALGFEGNQFTGKILPELRAIREKGMIRLLDLAFVKKDEQGVITSMEVSDLTHEEQEQFGAIAGALIGLGAGGAEGAETGAAMGARAGSENDFGMSEEQIKALAEDIPKNSSLALILFEHVWAAQLRDAVLDAGGIVIAQNFVRPDALIALGAQMAVE